VLLVGAGALVVAAGAAVVAWGAAGVGDCVCAPAALISINAQANGRLSEWKNSISGELKV